MREAHNAWMLPLPDAQLLLTLLAVAEAGSESEAATVLGIGQSSISRRLSTLQGSVGEPLTQRTAGGIKVTPAGARLLPHARQVRAALVAAARELGDAADPSLLRLDLGLSEHLAPRLAGALVSAAGAGSLSLTEGSSRLLLRRVQDGRIPAAVTLWAPAGAEPGFTAERVASDRLVFVALPGSPALRGGRLDQHELRNAPLLLPSEDSVVTARALALLRRHGLEPARLVTVGGASAVRSAALAGTGVGVTLQSTCASEAAAGWLSVAPWTEEGGAFDIWLLLADSLAQADVAATRDLVTRALTGAGG